MNKRPQEKTDAMLEKLMWDHEMKNQHAEWEDEPYRDDDEDYPIGVAMECYHCHPLNVTFSKCIAIGPVTGGSDPTQTYELACGHTVI